MDDSSLLAGSSWPAGGDGGAKAEDEELQCTRFVNWGRAIDVTCGLLGALAIQRSGSEGCRTPYCLGRFTSPNRLTWDTERGRGALARG